MKNSLFFLIVFFSICSVYGINDKIFSPGSSSALTLSQFLSYGNSALGDELLMEFANIYIEEAKLEGINWDIAFVQMCLETGFLKFGGLVDYGQNNFCGLGSFDSKKGASFSTIRDGVRAHIQHLKAYSTTEDLKGELLDPRFYFVKRGSAETVHDLAGKWAEDPKYGVKLVSLLKRMSYIDSDPVVLKAEIPVGFEPAKVAVEYVSEEVLPEVNVEKTEIDTPGNDTKVLFVKKSWVR